MSLAVLFIRVAASAAAVLGLALAASAQADTKPLEPITIQQAKQHYIPLVLKTRRIFYYRYSIDKRVTNCRRLSSSRVRCVAKWKLPGETGNSGVRYRGHVTVYRARSSDVVGGQYLSWTYEICMGIGGDHCIRRVRG